MNFCSPGILMLSTTLEDWVSSTLESDGIRRLSKKENEGLVFTCEVESANLTVIVGIHKSDDWQAHAAVQLCLHKQCKGETFKIAKTVWFILVSHKSLGSLAIVLKYKLAKSIVDWSNECQNLFWNDHLPRLSLRKKSPKALRPIRLQSRTDLFFHHITGQHKTQNTGL